jgi:signal transduction histidine kinase
MRRLYFRIYLAVLGSLALTAILAGISWHLFMRSDSWLPRPAFFVEAAARLLPPATAADAEMQDAVLHWADASGFDIAVFAPDGRRLADSSNSTLPPPFERKEPPRRGRALDAPHGTVGLALADGRWLMVGRPFAERQPLRRFAWLAGLLGIAGAVGIAAYPVVRRITRNLEDLERGVAALGAGDLSARVNISGNDEVARLAATYNRSAARIEELLAAHKSLLANASHELRTPLTRLRMGLEQLDPMTPQSVRDEIARNISELDELIEEILLASRLDTKVNSGFAPEAVDLVGLAAEECARTGAELDAPSTPLPLIHADAKLMRRLVRNLLDNAVKYGGKEVVVAVRQTGGKTELDVLDRGPGVPEAERDRIFEPFYRVAGGRDSKSGAGLGLALVRAIAHVHDATIAYLPREGGGSVFRLTIPVQAQSTKRDRANQYGKSQCLKHGLIVG